MTDEQDPRRRGREIVERLKEERRQEAERQANYVEFFDPSIASGSITTSRLFYEDLYSFYRKHYPSYRKKPSIDVFIDDQKGWARYEEQEEELRRAFLQRAQQYYIERRDLCLDDASVGVAYRAARYGEMETARVGLDSVTDPKMRRFIQITGYFQGFRNLTEQKDAFTENLSSKLGPKIGLGEHGLTDAFKPIIDGLEHQRRDYLRAAALLLIPDLKEDFRKIEEERFPTI
jgi:hypothetical protein